MVRSSRSRVSSSWYINSLRILSCTTKFLSSTSSKWLEHFDFKKLEMLSTTAKKKKNLSWWESTSGLATDHTCNSKMLVFSYWSNPNMKSSEPSNQYSMNSTLLRKSTKIEALTTDKKFVTTSVANLLWLNTTKKYTKLMMLLLMSHHLIHLFFKAKKQVSVTIFSEGIIKSYSRWTKQCWSAEIVILRLNSASLLEWLRG